MPANHKKRLLQPLKIIVAGAICYSVYSPEILYRLPPHIILRDDDGIRGDCRVQRTPRQSR